jgi:DDE_Tnp_1-associated
MDVVSSVFAEKSRLGALLQHFSVIEDPREEWRVLYPLPEILLLVVCGTIADCDDYEAIVAWGEQHLSFLRRFSAPLSPVRAGASRSTLAQPADEPDRSGAVLGLLHRLGARGLART